MHCIKWTRLFCLIAILVATATAARGLNLSTTATNETEEIWTGWHCTLTGGWIAVDAPTDVFNTSRHDSQYPHWVIDYSGFLNPVNPLQASGFVAHILPDSGTEVRVHETLQVDFVLQLSGGGLSMEQEPSCEYPTTSAVPEPAALLLALSSLPAVGLLRRRR